MKNKTAYFGVFTSLALILSYVETLIPIEYAKIHKLLNIIA